MDRRKFLQLLGLGAVVASFPILRDEDRKKLSSIKYNSAKREYLGDYSGYTNHGKHYTVYNTGRNKNVVVYQGSGKSGHQIPLGIRPTSISIKRRTSSQDSWITYNNKREYKLG